MHFIERLEHTRNEETGLLYGCQIQLSPLLSNNIASAAVYAEGWHRERRRNVISCQVDQTESIFDASLYFRGVTGVECTTITAAILLNNATGIGNFELCHKDSETTILQWLQTVDSLLFELMNHEVFAPRLNQLAEKFITSRSEADIELKQIFKDFYREKGLYVDSSDADAARAKLKERRRQVFQAGVEAGEIQIPRRSHRRRPAPPTDPAK